MCAPRGRCADDVLSQAVSKAFKGGVAGFAAGVAQAREDVCSVCSFVSHTSPQPLTALRVGSKPAPRSLPAKVTLFMWLRTAMNVQYYSGGDLVRALESQRSGHHR